MRDKLQRFMLGRYGVDELNRCLMVVAMACVVLDLFLRFRIFYLAGVLFLVVCYARMLSKNISKRFQENQKYLHYQFQVKEAFRKWKFKLQEARKFHIYKCPKCKQKIRIPRGRGKISIHCPKCGTDFIKHS